MTVNYVVFKNIISLFIVPFNSRTALYVVDVLQEQVKCRRKNLAKKLVCDKLYLSGLTFRHFIHYLPIIKEEHDLWTNIQPPKGHYLDMYTKSFNWCYMVSH